MQRFGINPEYRRQLVDQSGPYGFPDELVRFASTRMKGASRQPTMADLCCGTGRVVKKFEQRGWTCFASDRSRYLCPEPNADSKRQTHIGSLVEALSEIATFRFDAIVALDDAAVDLLDPDQRYQLLMVANDVLSGSGALIFQVERTTAATEHALLDEVRGHGLGTAWLATPAALDLALSPNSDNAASRLTIVAHR